MSDKLSYIITYARHQLSRERNVRFMYRSNTLRYNDVNDIPKELWKIDWKEGQYPYPHIFLVVE